MHRFPFILISALILCLIHYSTAQPYYVSPYRTRGISSTGTIDDPFDNLLLALNAAKSYDSTTIYLLYGYGNPHYVFLKELNPPDNATYDDFRSYSWFGSGQSGDNTLMEVKTVTIRPLYCYESGYPYNNSQYCAPTGQTLTMYMKTTEITFLVRGSVYIQNVIFDAVEDIKLWNTDTSYLENCIYVRTRCCTEKQTSSSYNVTCGPTYNDYSNLTINPLIGLFTFGSPALSYVTPSLTFTQGTIKNFVTPQLTSFVQSSSYTFALTLTNIQLDNMYFDHGLIYHSADSAAANASSIYIQDTTFSNYNYWNLRKLTSTRGEGYLFYTANIFSGVLNLLRSTFSSMTTSLRDKCWTQSTAYYNAPMNNLLTTQPRSRSDIWNQYHQDHLNRPYMSSLVYIKTLTGAVSITGSTFTNIIGTSGSVLRVDNAPTSSVWFTVYSSTFDGNFAYDGFANILIVQSSNAAFSRMLACPHIEVVNSNFINSYGCPGSYGNVASICYWDATPPTRTALSSYDTGSTASSDYNIPSDTNTNLQDFWVQQNEQYSYIRVKNSLFQNNQLAISNSLAIVGSYFTILDGNTFKNNGGTTGVISSVRLSGSYFLTRHPEQAPTDSTVHFGQSSAVYFDHLIKMTSRGNTFDGNWGPWEGSLALASSLTIKNWIKIENSVKSQNDIFINHGGVPSTITTNAPNDQVYSSPIFGISADYQGSLAVYELNSALCDFIVLAMTGVKFDSNTASYDYTNYSYNKNQLGTIITAIMKGRLRYSSGFIKLLLNYEAADLPSSAFALDTPITGSRFSLNIASAKITNNKLLSSGCLFPTQWADSYLLNSVTITNNQVFSAAAPLPQSSLLSTPSLTQALQTRHGLFCLSSQDSLDPNIATSLTASNLQVQNNNGVLFNLYPDSSASLYLSDSLFVQNNCSHSSIISLYDNTMLISTNNIFIANINALGNVFVTNEAQSTSVSNTYLQNIGTHASLVYLNNILNQNNTSYEILGKMYWNAVNPQYKLFYNNLAPQTGLYFQSSSWLEINLADFRENNVYSGLITSFQSSTKIISSTIQDHTISGTSVVGNFIFLSKVTLINTKILNCALSADPLVPVSQIAVIVLFTADLQAKNVIIDGGSSGVGTMLIFGASSKSSLNGFTIRNFHRLEGGQAGLIQLVSSTLNVATLSCNNVTSLFYIMSTELLLSSVTIGDMKAESRSQFLVTMSSSTLNINTLTYNSNSELGDLLPFVGADNSYINLRKANLLSIPPSKAKLFELKNSKQVLITESVFEYTALNLTTVFDLSSNADVSVTKSVFKNTGTVISATGARGVLYFVSNTLFSGAELETIILQQSLQTYIYDNSFLNSDEGASTELKQSKFQITNSLGTTNLYNNIFYSLYGLEGLIEVTAETSPYNLYSKNDIFINNKASAGGVFCLYVSKLWSDNRFPSAVLDGSIFLLNRAVTTSEIEGKGGAVLQSSPGQTKQVLTIKDSYFIKNTADVIGGAIYFDYSPPTTNSNSVFKENNANRLNHIGSYPVRLIQLDLSNPSNITYDPSTPAPSYTLQTSPYIWPDVPSGPISDAIYVFALLDMYNQVVYDDDLSIMELYPLAFSDTTRDLFSTKLALKAEQGLYIYDNFQFTYKVGESTELFFTTTAIQVFAQLPIEQLLMNASTEVQADFRMCNLGEFVVTDANGLSVCQACAATFWQLSPGSAVGSCQSCDTVKTYCLGGNNVGPRPGYWRLNSTSDVVIECPLPEACKGNDVPGNAVNPVLSLTGECADGYQGNVCNNCIAGWAKNNDGECGTCSHNIWKYLQFFVYIGMQVYIVSKEVKEVMELTESYRENDAVKTDLAILIRILMNYFQLISVAGGINISWPDVFGNVLSINTKIASFTSEVLSIDCFVTSDEARSIMVFIKILVAVAGPFVFIILGTLFWVVYFLIKKKPIRKNKEFGYRVVTTAIIICFNLQPTAITSSFSLFQCANLYREDSPLYFMTENYDISCWEGIHAYWILGLGLPALLLWVFILPLTMLFLLRRNKTKLHEDKIAKKYCFMYLGYKKDHYYWEFVIMARKILLIFGSVIATLHSINLQIYFTVILTISAYLLQLKHQPYTEKSLNNLEAISLISSEIVNFSGLYFQLIKRSLGLDITVLILALLANVYFFLAFIRLFFKARIHELARNKHVVKIVNWIQKYICCCIKTKKTLWEKMGVAAAVMSVPMQLKVLKKLKHKELTVATDSSVETPRDKGTDPNILSPSNQDQEILFTRMNTDTDRGLITDRDLSPRANAKQQTKSMFSNVELVQKSKNKGVIAFPKVVLQDSEKEDSEPGDVDENTERLDTEELGGYNIKRPPMTPHAKLNMSERKDSESIFKAHK